MPRRDAWVIPSEDKTTLTFIALIIISLCLLNFTSFLTIVCLYFGRDVNNLIPSTENPETSYQCGKRWGRHHKACLHQALMRSQVNLHCLWSVQSSVICVQQVCLFTYCMCVCMYVHACWCVCVCVCECLCVCRHAWCLCVSTLCTHVHAWVRLCVCVCEQTMHTVHAVQVQGLFWCWHPVSPTQPHCVLLTSRRCHARSNRYQLKGISLLIRPHFNCKCAKAC